MVSRSVTSCFTMGSARTNSGDSPRATSSVETASETWRRWAYALATSI
ncbi:hypothetical protein [Streptomyces sp. NPDC059894]